MPERERGRATLHVHTAPPYGDGLKTPSECLKLAEEAGFNVLAISDHDEIRGALVALEEAERRGSSVSIVIATEVTTAQGHLLVLFAKDKLPNYLSLGETIKIAHQQGALVVAPHVGVGRPFTIGSIAPQTIKELYKNGQPEEQLDGIEILNPYYTDKQRNIVANLCSIYNLAAIGSSDDHHGNLSRGPLTLFVGKTAADLKRSIENRQTLAIHSDLPPLVIASHKQLKQIFRGLFFGLSNKVARSPVLFSTLIALRLEELSKFIK